MVDVFILGAGFSKAVSAAMPSMKELSREVIAQLESSPFPIQDTLYAMGENVELWMTYLSQPQPWLSEEHLYRNLALATEIRRHICDVINIRTKAATRSIFPDWLVSLVNHWDENRAFVLTLNYDTLVESVSYVLPSKRREEFLIESIYPPYFANVLSRSGEGTQGRLRPETFSYYKLHGSTNLYYSGRSDFYGETLFFSKVPPWGNEDPEYESTERMLSRDKEVLIIPPVADKLTYFNNETVRRLWREASEALDAASRVFVIGYSLPPTDLGMTFFLQHSQPSENTAVYIVDEAPGVVTHYEKVLPKLRVMGDFAVKDGAVSKFVGKYPRLPSV